MKFTVIISVLFLLCSHVFAQNDTTTIAEQPKTPSYVPKKISKAAYASLLSAVLPGAGQVYNRTFWQIKLPIIYTGYTVLGYLIMSNHDNYREFRQAYINRKDQNPDTFSETTYNAYSDESLLRQRDKYRRDRDFYLILTLLWHGLNVAEAATTSHLNEFSVKDDIGFRFKPAFDNYAGVNSAGIRLEMPLFSYNRILQQKKLSFLKTK